MREVPDSSPVDSDGDGLDDDYEQTAGLDPLDEDTDGDTLTDGWEEDNGLDALDATGDNGRDGDPDGDGIPNYAEEYLGTDPNVPDDREVLGPSDVVIDKKMIQSKRDRTWSHNAYVQPADPEIDTICYLTYDYNLVHDGTCATVVGACDDAYKIHNWAETIVYDSTRDDKSLRGMREWTEDCDSGAPTTEIMKERKDHVGVLQNGGGITTTTNTFCDLHTESPAPVSVFYYPEWEVAWPDWVHVTGTTNEQTRVRDVVHENHVYKETIQLDDLYDRGMAVAAARGDLAAVSPFVEAEIESGSPNGWGQKLVVVGRDVGEFEALGENDSLVAKHDVTSYGERVELQKLYYGLWINKQTEIGMVYEINVVHLEEKEDTPGVVEVAGTEQYFVTGDGDPLGMYLDLPDKMKIDAPQDEGKVWPEAFKIEFDHQPGTVCEGFDPPESLVNHKPWPWTSVDKDGTNEICRLNIAPASLYPSVRVAVESGSNFATVTPTTFPYGSEDLTITGGGTEGDAIARARLGAGGPVCAELNIRALPVVTLTASLYEIADPMSSGTAPVGAPSLSSIVPVLNDVFRQACVQFIAGESRSVGQRYDVNGSGALEPEELDNLDFDSINSTGHLNVFAVKKSGLPGSSTNATSMLLGKAIYADDHPGGLLFVDDIGSAAAFSLVVGHEFGHALYLPVVCGDQDIAHDPGPWPATGDESLMRSGTPDAGGNVPQPGGWLRHEDWKLGNEEALNRLNGGAP